MKNILLISSIADDKGAPMNGVHSMAFVDRFPPSITEIHMKSLSDVSERS